MKFRLKKSSRIMALFLMGLFILVALSISPTANAQATGTTFNVTSPNCSGPGSIVEAIALANANPGPDTISITPSLQIDPINSLTCGTNEGAPDLYYLAEVTEDLIIEANGATLKGNQKWVTQDGRINLIGSCPSDFFTNTVVSQSPGFLKIRPGVNVEISDLKAVNLSAFAIMGQDSSLHLKGSFLNKIYDFYKSCNRPAIQETANATTTNVTIEDTAFFEIRNADDDLGPTLPPFSSGIAWNSAAIWGKGGVLAIKNSTFGGGRGVANWSGGTVHVESSRLLDSGWVNVYDGATVNIVNSAFGEEFADPKNTSRIIADDNSTVNIQASTFVIPYMDCVELPLPGGVGSAFCVGGPGTFLAKNGSTINFVESAFGTLIDTGDPRLVTIAGGTFTADTRTWMQPLTGAAQDAAALKDITGQTNLLTDPPGLPQGFVEWPASHTPLLGTPATPGVLIDVIPDSQCGGVNQLLSPIDGSCIDKDILGNTRWDKGNDRRNIGAIQLSLAPHLWVTGTGDGTVDLAWSRPFDPASGAITGYAVLYRPAGSSDPFTRVDVSGPDTLTQQVTGLTNGTEYEFQVVGVNNVGDGPPSNRVTATPLGPIGAPVVTAMPGDRQVGLSWTEPDPGGHIGLTYTVLYHPVGDLGWEIWSTGFTGLTTTITGLTNGKEYEFGVIATATDGEIGTLGTTTATPFKSVTPPEPGTENCTLTAGYWSSHSEYGPSLYDSTWAKLANGADTPFFLSGQSYYEVINTAPKGNAYYNLAHQYIAAELNFLRGADPADVQSTFDAATQLFNTYSPDAVKDLKGPATEEWTDLALVLDDYNNGYTGPGHCTE